MSEATNTQFEPRVVGFICNWGAYSGLEMAGVMRKPYGATVRFVRVRCLGRVSTGLVLRAFELGADGVLLLGCRSEECHYGFGIGRAKQSSTQMAALLNLAGIGALRLSLVESPAGDGMLFASQVKAFAARIKKLGPSPLGSGSPVEVSWGGELLPGGDQRV